MGDGQVRKEFTQKGNKNNNQPMKPKHLEQGPEHTSMLPCNLKQRNSEYEIFASKEKTNVTTSGSSSVVKASNEGASSEVVLMDTGQA